MDELLDDICFSPCGGLASPSLEPGPGNGLVSPSPSLEPCPGEDLALEDIGGIEDIISDIAEAPLAPPKKRFKGSTWNGGDSASGAALVENEAHQDRMTFYPCKDQFGLEPAAYPLSKFHDRIMACFRDGRRRALHVATDCSGADAPIFAWKSFQRCFARQGYTLDIEHEFSSEHPKAKGCHQFIIDNHAPKRLYSDMLSNPSSSGETICHDPALAKDTFGRVPLPDFGVVDVYDAGFECQDRSLRNTKPKPLSLDWDVASDATAGVSSRTLMASLLRITAIGPRVIRLENVGNCEMDIVLEFVQNAFPDYAFGLFRFNSADFRSPTERDRYWLIGVWRPCLLAPFFRMGIGASRPEVFTARRRRLQTFADLCVCTCGGGASKDTAAWMESVCPCHGGALGGRSRAGASSIGPICPLPPEEQAS